MEQFSKLGRCARVFSRANRLCFPLQKSQMSKALPTVDPKLGERAMLVKDAEGDYAVIVGRWEVLRSAAKTGLICESNFFPVQ